jgi:poly(3-hydroxybutyrate) depolymerase
MGAGMGERDDVPQMMRQAPLMPQGYRIGEECYRSIHGARQMPRVIKESRQARRTPDEPFGIMDCRGNRDPRQKFLQGLKTLVLA